MAAPLLTFDAASCRSRRVSLRWVSLLAACIGSMLETMPAHRRLARRSAARAIGLCALLGTFASSARADEGEATGAAPRGRLGIGVGGSWLPLFGGASTLVARFSVGFDAGRFSLRALPTFQYVYLGQFPATTMSAGYLAVESAFKVTPEYSVSIAPLAGYAHSPDPDPQCFDVCHESLGNGLMFGADVSPATFSFGRDDSLQVGLHGSFFEFARANQ